MPDIHCEGISLPRDTRILFSRYEGIYIYIYVVACMIYDVLEKELTHAEKAPLTIGTHSVYIFCLTFFFARILHSSLKKRPEPVKPDLLLPSSSSELSSNFFSPSLPYSTLAGRATLVQNDPIPRAFQIFAISKLDHLSVRHSIFGNPCWRLFQTLKFAYCVFATGVE